MILCDDNIAALARMRACSVDAVVTDPPIEREVEYATIAEAREQHALTYTTR